MNVPVETPSPVQAVGELASQSHKIGTIFAAASRDAETYVSGTIDNPNHAGVRLFFNLTNVGAAGTVTAKIQVQDPASQGWMDLAGAVTAALAAVALTSLTVYPGIGETANAAVSEHLGRKWRVSVTVGANAVAFSVGGEYLGS